MEEKKVNEEVQTRREFFKDAAKKTLPFIGAIALVGFPRIMKASEFPQSMGCDYGCHNGCSTTCGDPCENTCKGGCDGTCKGSCEETCKYYCDGSCKGGCEGDCRGGCSGYCSSSNYY